MSSLSDLPAPRQRRTTSDEVADVLRESIIAGHFQDGETLNQVELARHFGVSRVPLREALRRLEAEGLITAEAHRRVVVHGLNRARISEIFEIRALLEAFIVERSAPNLGPDELAELRRICEAMEQTQDHDAWVKQNDEFHRHLSRCDEAPAAAAIVERLSRQVARYLRRKGGVIRRSDAGREHREILDALESSDVARAVSGLSRHILATRDAVLQTLPPEHI